MNKICCRCEKHLDFFMFSRKKSSSDGRMSFCKICDAKRQGRDLKLTKSFILSPEKAGYLSGLIDGEGHLGMTAAIRKKGKYKGSGLVHVRMVIAITSPEIYDIAHEYNIGKIYEHKPKNPKHKTRFDWTIRSNEMKVLLPILLPYLRIKTKQANLILEYFDLPRSKDEVYRSQVKKIYEQLKVLNTRGRPQKILDW